MARRGLGFDGLRQDLARRRRKRLAEGGFFQRLMQRHAARVLRKQAKRARGDALRAQYSDYTNDELCGMIVRRACWRAAAVGGTAGAIITGGELVAVISFGHPVGLAFAVALIEFALLERMQIRMVFTLAELRQVQMAHDHLHEVSALYGHVLKVKGATRVAAYGRQGAMLLFRTVGVRFAQRAAVKFAIPIVAIVMGGLLNFGLTLALGRHSNDRFRKQAKINERLSRLLAHDDHCHRLLLSLMTVMAAADGLPHRLERELILRTLDGLGLSDEARAQLLDDLDDDEAHLLGTLSEHPDARFKALVLEFMSLAAVVEGSVSPSEYALLGRVAAACGRPLDQDLLLAEHAEFLNRKSRRARLLERLAKGACARDGESHFE